MKRKQQLIALMIAATSGLGLFCAGGAQAQTLKTNWWLPSGSTRTQLRQLKHATSAEQKLYAWNLFSVSCPRHDSCEAVGVMIRQVARKDTLASVDYIAFAEHWNGKRWSAQRVVVPARESELLSVSCYAPDACVAVGIYTNDARERGGTKPFTERWDGIRWHRIAIRPPHPKRSQAILENVSCSYLGQCTAAGEIQGHAGGVRLFLERLNGSKWSQIAAPGKQDATDTILSCPTTDGCFAITSDDLAIAREVGTRWVTQKLSLPRHVSNLSLSSLSCVTADDCFAVGQYFKVKKAKNYFSVVQGPVIEHFDGRSWRRMLLPIAAYKSFSGGSESASCSSVAHCVVTGLYADRSVLTLALTDGIWRVANRGERDESAISCPDFDYCVGLGSSSYVTSKPQPKRQKLAAIFNGSIWRATRVPLPAFNFNYKLN